MTNLLIPMECVFSKGFGIEPREDHYSPPSEAVVVVTRETPSHPSLQAKSYSFHGFEKPDASMESNKAVFTGFVMTVPRVEDEGINPVKENFFNFRDRMEMQRAGKDVTFDRHMNGRGLTARTHYPGFTPCGALEETTVFQRLGRSGELSELGFVKDERRRNHRGNDNDYAVKVEDFRFQKMDFQSDELLNLVLLRIKG